VASASPLPQARPQQEQVEVVAGPVSKPPSKPLTLAPLKSSPLALAVLAASLAQPPAKSEVTPASAVQPPVVAHPSSPSSGVAVVVKA
jgi:hypothetical protein